MKYFQSSGQSAFCELNGLVSMGNCDVVVKYACQEKEVVGVFLIF